VSDSQRNSRMFDERARKIEARTSDNDATFTVCELKASAAAGASGLAYSDKFPESNELLGSVDILILTS
jgi:hypothetical protein